MAWNLEEAVAYYQSLGAPQDFPALTALMKEIQRENSGGIPKSVLPVIADAYGVPTGYLLAVIKRIPSLRLADSHLLEICAGENCRKSAGLAVCAEKLKTGNTTVRFVPCMRLCGKGPNIRWDGKPYHHADESLLRQLFND